jgi:hypothetical protein
LISRINRKILKFGSECFYYINLRFCNFDPRMSLVGFALKKVKMKMHFCKHLQKTKEVLLNFP